MADDWQWCGFAHHFVGAEHCRFHLATFVAGGRWLVSTVGDYRPNGDKQAIIGGYDALYETMVFATDPTDLHDGEPTVIDWSDSWCQHYGDGASATQGHLSACREWDARRG